MDCLGQGGEKALGLPITQEQIDELEAHADDINFDVARQREKGVPSRCDEPCLRLRSPVPPRPRGLSIWAPLPVMWETTPTSSFSGRGLEIVTRKLVNVIQLLADFALQYKDLPCLAYTHLQPAQLTTVGKEGHPVDKRADDGPGGAGITALPLSSCWDPRALTGTQASFVELFDGDSAKIKALEESIAREMGFERWSLFRDRPIPGRWTPTCWPPLSGVAQSASKFSNDLRLLQNFKEMEEPFEAHQIGSSAMPYKRNPMRSERITSLARCDGGRPQSTAVTAATQWFERTLDDSANKRISVAGGFPGSGRHPQYHAQRLQRAGGLSQGH